MRKPKFLSPSSIKAWENRDEFYLKYLAENRPERFPQTQPMSVGSAFDAYIKSFLHNRLFGCCHPQSDDYKLDVVFEKQVEAHNRDWARIAGKHVFDRYCLCGAMADLMLELQKAAGPPRFEFDIKGFVAGKMASVPVLGKPDVFFTNANGARVVLDWKVNGYCSKSAVSPKPGYVKCRDGWLGSEKRASRRHMLPHPDCYPANFKGMLINPGIRMEQVDVDWANQLSIYSWLLGEDIGSQDVIIGIDQIVGQPGENGNPWLRVASHRCRIGSDYQFALHQHVQDIWQIIESGWIFRNMTQEQSAIHQQDLDDMAKSLTSDDDLGRFMNTLRQQ